MAKDEEVEWRRMRRLNNCWPLDFVGTGNN